MKKKTMFALVALAASMTASAALQLKPNGTQPPYYWDDTSLWWNTSSGGAWANRVPNNTEEVDIFSPETREGPLYITNGVNAVTKAFYLATTNATSCSPQLLTIDGGSLTASGAAYLGFKNSAIVEIKNGGSMVATSTLTMGRDNDTSTGTKCITNIVRIADASSSLSVTSTATIGQQRKGLTLIDNRGTINLNGDTNIGNCNDGKVLVTYGDVVTVVTNAGTINANKFRIGYRTNCVARVENMGDLNVTGEFTIGSQANSYGFFRHSAGDLSITSGHIYLGIGGRAYFELAGDTRTIIDQSRMRFALNNWNSNDNSFRSYGELVITNSASLSRGGKDIDAAVHEYKYGMARIALYNNAMLSEVGTLNVGNAKADSSFEVYDNAVVSNVNLLVLNAGDTSTGAGTTRMKIFGNAKVCDIKNAFIGSNKYNKAELEIADNAWFGLCDDAWNGDSTNVITVVDDKVVTNKVAGAVNNINVARDYYNTGNATIRLRGGAIGLGIRGGLVLGSTNDNSSVTCTSRLVGYGCITNQGDSSRTLWSRLDLRGGSVTADGEGEERDLDVSTFARLGVSAGDGRSHLNSSGTNGWYAVNKGRLIYPNRDNDKAVRFVGEYARLASNVYPKLVNSMRILLKDSNGTEITSSARKFTIELYAPDRTDIPAGLIENDAKNRRLGVWRGNCTRTTSFATADTLIRYDQWRLAELKDGNGNYPANLEVRLYQYDGTKWEKIASYPAEEAATNNYRISGTLAKTSVASANLGWFAVVAKATTGTMISIR